ncbi:peptidase inhibitor family I36 protein [Micromonospora sp. NPDC049230]|uniref:peptidase inhibitor family I36 protein n=1 Tax=Micromonospora sp. NPDC049230 TaxID=3155502 RepID=UPI0034029101
MTNGTTRVRLLAATVLCAAAPALALTATPAGASATGAAADSTCTTTRTLCLWDGTSYTGERFTAQADDPSTGTCVNLAAHGWGSGRAESARNTANLPARLYTTTNCTGSYYQIMPAGSYGSISYNSNSVYVY